jgi:hypothetical protein
MNWEKKKFVKTGKCKKLEMNEKFLIKKKKVAWPGIVHHP